MRKAFTLIELLVVISIIALLIAILLPVLGTARENTKQVSCLSNARQLGIGVFAFTNDHEQDMPSHDSWSNWVGTAGDTNLYNSDLSGFVHEGKPGTRPINEYIEHPSLSACPSDIGDPLQNVDSAYDAYGNSYLIQWGGPFFGVATVSGRPGATQKHLDAFNLDDGSYHDRSGNRFAGGPLEYKLLFSEWNWHANRRADAPNIQWHNPGGATRQMNTQFADGHAEFYAFPANFEAQSGNVRRSPDLEDKLW